MKTPTQCYHVAVKSGTLKALVALVCVVPLVHTSLGQTPPKPQLAFASDRTGRLQIHTVQPDPLGSVAQRTFEGSAGQEARAPDWSRFGRIAYQFGASGVRSIHRINADGSDHQRLTLSGKDERDPSWSPDGLFIVYASNENGTYDLWIHDVTGATDYLLIASTRDQLRPSWSPDGNWIAYVSNEDLDNEIMVIPVSVVDGTVVAGSPAPKTINTDNDFNPCWSPDSLSIAFQSTRGGNTDIYRMDLASGEASIMRLTTHSGSDSNPAWSPDGSTVAFVSDRDGNSEIYVMSATSGEADVTALRRITNDAGQDVDPAWEPTGPTLEVATLDPTTRTPTSTVHPSIFRRPSQYGPNPQKGYGILVEITTQPNILLHAYAQAISNSGGHNHSNTPRKHGWLYPGNRTWASLMKPVLSGGLMGPPTAGGTLQYGTYEDALVLSSGPTGVTNFWYVAPEISGTEDIIVSTESTTPEERIAVTNQVSVFVPNLGPLAVNTSITFPGQQCGCTVASEHFNANGLTTMTLIGGRCAHPSSWNGTPEMVRAMRALAVNYQAHNSLRLPVNDMALPWGGMFDIGPSLCAGETAYNPFWEAGGHFGHRLGTEVDIGIDPDPSNYGFERILSAQGWWLNNPSLWKSEGNHYHLNLSGSGRITIEPTGPNAVVQQSWNAQTRSLILTVASENRGGLDADEVNVTELSASGGVTFRGLTLPLNLGSMTIRQSRSFNIEAVIPPALKSFSLRWAVEATSTGNPGQVFVSQNTKNVRVPAPSPFRFKDGFVLGNLPGGGAGDWAIELFPSNHVANIGTDLIFNATISNNSGGELFISDQSLWLQTAALSGSYHLDWAPEFFATGGIIGVGGYSGPLVVLRWLLPPPAGSVSIGELELITDGQVPNSLLRASFTSGSSPPRLDISHTTNTVTLSWPSSMEGLWLESSDGLDAVEWLRVQETTSTADGTNFLTIPIGTTSEFFRLNAPW